MSRRHLRSLYSPKGKVISLAVGLMFQGLAGVAQAQSSVTLYGVVDSYIDISNQGNGTLVRELSGAPMGSRWGLQGKEDLGGGWSSVFTLESGFGINNGASQQGGLLFGRQAFVGISGTPGTLTFGRQYSPEFWALAFNDPFLLGWAGGLPNISRTLPNGEVAGTLESYLITSRTNNSAVYTSPSLYGLTVRAMYAFGGVAGSLKDGQTVSIGGNYAQGPVTLNAGYVRNVVADGSGDLIEWTAGGSYAIGPAHIYLAYTRDTDSSGGPRAQYSLANLGVNYQITAALGAMAQVIKIVDTSNGLAQSQNAYEEAVALTYSLSKRTMVYAAYGQVQNKHGSTYSLGSALYLGAPATPNATARSCQIGMRTQF
jgi:predicted porin